MKWRRPSVEPDKRQVPTVGRHARRGRRHFRLHQIVTELVRDTVFEMVAPYRGQVLRRQRTLRFRAGQAVSGLATGVNHAPISRWARH